MALRFVTVVSLLVFLLLAHAMQEGTKPNLENAEMAARKSVPLSDREKAGLRGPVKTCGRETVFVAASSGNGPELKSITATEYDRDGRLLSMRSANPNGPDWISSNSYDAEGRLLKTISGRAGMESIEAVYSYDENGRLLTVLTPRNGGKSEFRYDQQGRKLKLQSFDPKLFREEQAAFSGSPFEAAEAGFGAPRGGSLKTIYNEQDVGTEVQTLDAEGHIVSRITRTFDSNGRVIAEKHIFENAQFLIPPEGRAKVLAESGVSAEELAAELDKQLRAALGGEASFYGRSNKYDAQGRITEVRTRAGPGDEQIVTTTYNDHGDIAAEEHVTTWPVDAPGLESGNAAPPPAPWPPEHFELRYEYSYDSFGNWTEQTAKLRSNPDEPFKVSSTTHRKLTYY